MTKCAHKRTIRRMTGQQLRNQRQKLGISPLALAARMGIHRTRIPHIEATAEVSDRLADRYIEALLDLASEEARRGQYHQDAAAGLPA